MGEPNYYDLIKQRPHSYYWAHNAKTQKDLTHKVRQIVRPISFARNWEFYLGNFAFLFSSVKKETIRDRIPLTSRLAYKEIINLGYLRIYKLAKGTK